MLHHNGTATHPRRRRARTLTMVGAAIAAMGLALTMVTSATAGSGWLSANDNPPTTAPRRAQDIPNVTIVEDKIALYYGSVTKKLPPNSENGVPGTPGEHCPFGIAGPQKCLTQQTVPASDSNYARQMHRIARRAERVLRAQLRRGHHGRWWHHHHGKPALVFDVDDTLLNTYNYETAESFSYTPASNASWVRNELLPAVPGMVHLVNWASNHGYTIFFITGRPGSQLTATKGNLQKTGYHVRISGPGGHGLRTVYLNNPSTERYLTCGSDCSTIQYKSQTRKHIQSLGYDIIGNFGDQYSDLKGGHSRYSFKLPNPMYYLP